MARDNRIILTAARPDRTSFGCGAGFQYLVYDRCLYNPLDHSGSAWQEAYAVIRDFLWRRGGEAAQIKASEPQAQVWRWRSRIAGSRP